MTLDELRERWQARRDEWSRLGVAVDGSKLAAEVVADLESINADTDDQILNLTTAGRIVDMNPDSIGRAVRQGRLENFGRPKAPKVRRGDVVALAERKQRPHRSGGRSTRPSSLGAITRDAIAAKLPRIERG